LDKKYIILFAFITIAIAFATNQQTLAQYAYGTFYDRILDYCFDNVDKILQGQNPVQELVTAGLIPTHFKNMTCSEVSNEAILGPELEKPGNTTATELEKPSNSTATE
jgi:hypothetical protein